MAQMEIYYQMESKENREDKNAQKICRKISESGGGLMWRARQLSLQVGLILCPSRPDQIWMKWGLHAAPSCVASYNSYLVRDQAA